MNSIKIDNEFIKAEITGTNEQCDTIAAAIIEAINKITRPRTARDKCYDEYQKNKNRAFENVQNALFGKK